MQLCVTHDLKRFAVFDQFAYTPHLECGVHLSLKKQKPTETEVDVGPNNDS
jgi:hypothetical protein